MQIKLFKRYFYYLKQWNRNLNTVLQVQQSKQFIIIRYTIFVNYFPVVVTWYQSWNESIWEQFILQTSTKKTQRRRKTDPKSDATCSRAEISRCYCAVTTFLVYAVIFLNRPMNGGGWMLLLEQPNQEALLQEFKGLCGTLCTPQTLNDSEVRPC